MQFNLSVSTEEVNVITAILGKAPFETVAGLLNNIVSQVREQEAAPVKTLVAERDTLAKKLDDMNKKPDDNS